MKEQFYTSWEVQKMLRISRNTLHSWIRQGIVKPVKITNRHFLYKVSEIDKLINGK